MRGLLVALVVVAVLACIFVPQVNASQYFVTTQKIRAYATGDWSFLSAWDLYNGQLQVSPDFYSGYYEWSWTMCCHQHWFALFVYDDGTGQTRELCWAYSQDHIQ